MGDDSDEKQLLVRQSGTTAVINVDSFVMHRAIRYLYFSKYFKVFQEISFNTGNYRLV